MNYATFRDLVKKYPIFRSNILPHLDKHPATLRRQIVEWCDKKYIHQLKRGVYTLRDEDRAVKFSSYFLANNLYTPSYISLETALSYYGFIPERVETVTSISSKKTQRFTNNYRNFVYHHIAADLYGDFVTTKDEYGNNFFIATPERAIIDFLYLKTRGLKNITKDIFETSYRLQNLDLLNKSLLRNIEKKFQQKKLTQLTRWLIEYMEA